MPTGIVVLVGFAYFLQVVLADPNLFPELRTLVVRWDGTNVDSRISFFTSKSLQRIVHREYSQAAENHLSLVHASLAARNRRLSSVEIRGSDVDGHLITNLLHTSLTNNFSLTLSPHYSENPVFQRDQNWFMALATSHNLTSLRIDGSFASQNVTGELESQRDYYRIRVLQQLDFQSIAGRYHQLLKRCRFPQLTTISIKTRRMESWDNWLTALSDSAPRLTKLSITVPSSSSPELVGGSLRVTEAEIIGSVLHLAKLESSILSGPRSIPLSDSTLSTIIQNIPFHLEKLCLPVDFTKGPILSFRNLDHPNTKLKKLCFCSQMILPEPLRNRISIAEFLCYLAPSARALPFRGHLTPSLVVDFEDLRRYVAKNIQA
ncbi:hypothetical protein NP233_g10076 [Leucocoprinus birnbaumii]|uniref:Uncharacterized protein n=1 Tax=Leucocoprinus birnbaumii TaxID=56174 RepID=A0AAD5YLN0_9AGAR|nr:hypothetical protein NP233_g10076 [Leucocoprinus birnbaumii]